MRDPGEGVAPDGTIRTGARRDRIPALYEPLVRHAAAMVGGTGASLYIYGSVATGTAQQPNPAAGLPSFPAGARAARGFNGDIAAHLHNWRTQLASGTPEPLAAGARIARKTLLAVAGLVSVHDCVWTTDRSDAARRWSEVEPALADGLGQLHSWISGNASPTRRGLDEALGDSGVVAHVVTSFRDHIGLWSD